MELLLSETWGGGADMDGKYIKKDHPDMCPLGSMSSCCCIGLIAVHVVTDWPRVCHLIA